MIQSFWNGVFFWVYVNFSVKKQRKFIEKRKGSQRRMWNPPKKRKNPGRSKLCLVLENLRENAKGKKIEGKCRRQEKANEQKKKI